MKKIVAVLTLCCFVLVHGVRPVQAAVPAMAIIPAAAIGAAILTSGAATHYAPALYEAGQLVAHNSGEMLREVITAQKIYTKAISDVTGELIDKNYYVGMYNTAMLNMEHSYQWWKDRAASIPDLWAQMMNYENDNIGPKWSENTTFGDVVAVYDFNIGGEISERELDGLTGWSEMNAGGICASSAQDTWSVNNLGRISRYLNVAGVRYAYKKEWRSSCGGGWGGWAVWYKSHSSKAYSGTAEPVSADSIPHHPPMIWPGFKDAFVPSQTISGEIDWAIKQPAAPVTWVQGVPATVDHAPPYTGWTDTNTRTALDIVRTQIAIDEITRLRDLVAANPNDAGLAAELVKAETVFQSGQIAQPEMTSPADTFMPPAAIVPPTNQIDFSPLLSVSDGILLRWPFSMINGLATTFDVLTASPAAPSINVPLLMGEEDFVLDMSAWDAAAAWMRGIIGFFFHISIVYAIIRAWRGA